MKKSICILATGLFLSSLGASRPKYTFLFIGDGMSTPQRMVAEEFSEKIGHGPLAMNTLSYQASTRTKSANAIITDSAAADSLRKPDFKGLPRRVDQPLCLVGDPSDGKSCGVIAVITFV